MWPLFPVIRALESQADVEVAIIATGAHPTTRSGSTTQDLHEVTRSSVYTIEATVDKTEALSLTRSLASMVDGLGQLLQTHPIDVLLLLGDRWELLAAASAALFFRIPIAHVHGGEVTEGAIDDRIRHAISKLADIHFCATEDSARRIMQLGEERQRIHVTGAPSLDRFDLKRSVDRAGLEALLGIEIVSPFGLLTYHPPTASSTDVHSQVETLLRVCEEMLGSFVMTYPGIDLQSDEIVETIKLKANQIRACAVVPDLGDLYPDALGVADILIGNSSSGIIEAATFGLPVIDVGIRQKGRMRPKNVIHSDGDEQALRSAIAQALKPSFRDSLRDLVNPYGDGRASERIGTILRSIDLENLEPKRFIDSLESS